MWFGWQERALPTWNTTFHEYAVERGLDYVAFILDGKVQLNVTKAYRFFSKLTTPPLNLQLTQLIVHTQVRFHLTLYACCAETRKLVPQFSGMLNGI